MAAPGSVADRLGEKGRVILYLNEKRIGSVPLDLVPKEKPMMMIPDQKRISISFTERFKTNLVDILLRLLSGD